MIYTYTGKRKHTIYHHFTCGKCGKTTEWMPTVINVETTVETRMKGEGYMQEQLQLALTRDMNAAIALIEKGAKKGNYFGEGTNTPLNSTCPYCKCKNRTRGGVGLSVINYGVGGLFIGLVVVLIWAFFGEIYLVEDLIVPIMAVIAIILAGCVLGFFVGKKEANESVEHTNVEYRFYTVPLH